MTLQERLSALIGGMKTSFSALSARVTTLENAGGGSGVVTHTRDYTSRFYLYADQRWISAGDANYGLEDINSTENSGTGVTPIIEWENIGSPFETGDHISGLQFRLRGNNLEITDLEFYVVFVYPDAETRWIAGFDNDAEVTVDLLYNSLHLGRIDNVLTANINDRTRQVISIDYDCPAAGEMRVFVRPVGIPVSTRYTYCQTIINYEPA